MTVKVVKPINITEAVLTASSIPEPDDSVGEVEWIEDRFNGIDVSSIIPSSHVVRDMKLYLGNYYIIAGPEFSNPTMYVISDSGSLVSSFSMPVFSLAITLHNDFIYSVTGGDSIFKHKISDGSVIQSIDISSNVKNARAVDFYSSKFFIFDSSDSKIKQFNDTLVYDNFEFTIAGGSLSVSSVKIFDGFIYSVELITANSIKKYSLSGELSNAINFESGLSCFDLKSDGYYFMPYSGSKLLLSYNDDFVYSGLYQAGDRAILTSTHKLYQCVKATNIRPDLGATGDETETWVEVGATNKFASFDERLSYPAKITGTQSFELTLADRVNTVAFLNISGITSVRVQMEVGGSIVYDTTKDGLDASLIYDHYTWWFGDIELVSELIFDDLPPYPTSKLIIDVTGEGGIGQIVTGFAKVIGECLAESNSNTIDLSTQEFDAFGNQKYVPKPIIKLNKYEILSDKSIAPAVERLFRELSGKNALWIGEIGSGQLLTTYGYTERSPIQYNMPTAINYSATIRGSA